MLGHSTLTLNHHLLVLRNLVTIKLIVDQVLVALRLGDRILNFEGRCLGSEVTDLLLMLVLRREGLLDIESGSWGYRVGSR
jgi:hypothetical protein